MCANSIQSIYTQRQTHTHTLIHIHLTHGTTRSQMSVISFHISIITELIIIHARLKALLYHRRFPVVFMNIWLYRVLSIPSSKLISLGWSLAGPFQYHLPIHSLFLTLSFPIIIFVSFEFSLFHSLFIFISYYFSYTFEVCLRALL